MDYVKQIGDRALKNQIKSQKIKLEKGTASDESYLKELEKEKQ